MGVPLLSPGKLVSPVTEVFLANAGIGTIWAQIGQAKLQPPILGIWSWVPLELPSSEAGKGSSAGRYKQSFSAHVQVQGTQGWSPL